MINPKPVDERRSPYSATANPTPLPIRPLPPPVTTLTPPPIKPKRRWPKFLALGFLALVLGAGIFAYTQYRSFTGNLITDHEGASSNVLKNDLDEDKINAANYVKPGDGRFNIVIVGVGGENHPGGKLTDTIQVVSVDTVNKKTSTTSIPRDLYVNIPNYGRSKINAVYTVAEQKKAGSGPQAVREVVGNVLGITVTNFALIDFSGIKDLIDDLGGIDVDVPKAISDHLFPCDDTVKYCPFSIKAGQQHMNGTTALKYSRSRETTSDFDRAARQQIVMQAIKKKALSAGVLANPVKIAAMTKTLGTHFKTDMQQDDILAFISVYKDISPENTSSAVIDTSAALGLLTDTSDPVAGYISYPKLGIEKYDAIHQWWHKNNPDPLMARETPSVTVTGNGKATEKQIQAIADKLKDYGYAVTVSETPVKDASKYTSTQVFTKDDKKKKISANYLRTLLGVSTSSKDSNISTDFLVVVTPSSASASVSNSTTKSSTKASPSPAATPKQ